MNREDEEREQRKSSVDRVNDLINKAQDVKKNVQRIQKGIQTVQKGVQAARGGVQAAQGASSAAEGAAAAAGAVEGAAAGGVGAAGGGSLLAAIIIIIFLFILIFIVIILLLSGGSQGGGTCYQIKGATCQSAFTKCPAGTMENQAQTCNYTAGTASDTLICCVPEPSCTGTCEKGPTDCSSSTDIPDLTASCTDTTTPLCCVPKSSNSNSSIVYWASIIAGDLENLGWGYCGQPDTNICNTAGYCAVSRSGLCRYQSENATYYCTNLVIDAYNLAGIKNSFSDWVPTMIDQWGKTAGFSVAKYVTYTSLSQLKPGDVIFWVDTAGDASTGEHVVIVSSTANLHCPNAGIQSGCYGQITILQANSDQTSATLQVINNQIMTQELNIHGFPMSAMFGYNGL